MDEKIAGSLIHQAMRLAVDEAKKGLGGVFHNPPVGCVILSSAGDILAKGHHQVFGGPHAEINALKEIKDQKQLEGATVVVTLEPCAFEGKTPSCAKKLATLPIKEVVYGLEDPNPKVSGQGAKILQAAGIKASLYQGDNCPLEDLAEKFLWVHRNGSPFVALKMAVSSNDSIDSGSSDKWLTGAESREHVHYLRAQYDAVLIGVNTFLVDNPSLNIRWAGEAKENMVVVLDPKGRGLKSLSGSQLEKVRAPEKIIWVVDQKVGGNTDVQSKVQTIKIKLDQGRFDLRDLMVKLFERNIHSIFVEGGAATYRHFLEAGLVNRIYKFESPKVVDEKSIRHWRGGFHGDLKVLREERASFGVDRFVSMKLK